MQVFDSCSAVSSANLIVCVTIVTNSGRGSLLDSNVMTALSRFRRFSVDQLTNAQSGTRLNLKNVMMSGYRIRQELFPGCLVKTFTVMKLVSSTWLISEAEGQL